MFRDQNLANLRPNITFEEIHSNEIQLFQDKTLRPILKFQHVIIIELFEEYLSNHNINFNQITAAQRNNKIDQSIKKTQSLQALLKGTIIGLFMNDEMDFWKNNKIEVNKRIQQLLIKRIQSAYAEKITI